MPGILDIGAIANSTANTAANGVVGAALGLALEHHNDKRQLEQQQKLQDQQIAGNKEMVDYNYGKQLDMWNATSYPAQIANLQKAGLNPGLMYGMGGGGGQTAGTPSGSVNGAEAPKGGQEIIAQQGMGLQLALLESQKRVLDTQADKNAAEAAKTAGPDTKLTNTQTESLTQGIDNQKAVEALTKVQTQIAQFDAHIKGETLEASIAMAKMQMKQVGQQLTILENEALISENTWSEKIDIVTQQLAQAVAQNELTRAQTTKTGADTAKTQAETTRTQAETQQLAKTIALQYAQLANEKDKTLIQKKLQEFQTSYGGQASQILGQLLQFIPKPGK
jgi:hypothetical protein